MVLDKEEHRDMLLQLINAATIPGSAVMEVAELKRAVQEAILPDQIEGACAEQ